MNKKLIFLLKLTFTITILYFLIKNININQSIETFFRINPVVFISMIVLFIIGQGISAYKWSIIGTKLGFDYKLSQYFDYYFTGMFFNLFLPTGVGGDITKAYYLCKNKPETSKTAALFSVLADRFTGVMVLAVIFFVGLFFAPAQHLSLTFKMIISFCFIGMLLFVFIFTKINKIGYLMKNSYINRFNNCIELLCVKSLCKIFFVSFIFHSLMLVIHFGIGKTMGLNIPVSYYLILYPVTSIVSLIPISINGIGVREATYVYLLKAVSVNPSQGLVFGLCWFAIIFLSSLLGSFFYMKNNRDAFKQF